MMFLKNWLTTIPGLLGIVTGLYHCYDMGKIDVQCVINILLGSGLLVAKSFNVTGGTVPSTNEAEIRVERDTPDVGVYDVNRTPRK